MEAEDSIKSIGKHCENYLNQNFLLKKLLFFAFNSNTYLSVGWGKQEYERGHYLIWLTTYFVFNYPPASEASRGVY